MTEGAPAGRLTSPIVPAPRCRQSQPGGGPQSARSSVCAPNDESDVQPGNNLLSANVQRATAFYQELDTPERSRVPAALGPSGRAWERLTRGPSHGIEPVKPRAGAGSVRRTRAVHPAATRCGTRRAVIPPGPSVADGRIDALMFDRALQSTYERRPGSPRAEARSRPATTTRGGGVEAGWSGRGTPVPPADHEEFRWVYAPPRTTIRSERNEDSTPAVRRTDGI